MVWRGNWACCALGPALFGTELCLVCIGSSAVWRGTWPDACIGASAGARLVAWAGGSRLLADGWPRVDMMTNYLIAYAPAEGPIAKAPVCPAQSPASRERLSSGRWQLASDRQRAGNSQLTHHVGRLPSSSSSQTAWRPIRHSASAASSEVVGAVGRHHATGMADEPLVSLPRLVGKRVERHRTDAVPATACHALVERHEQGRLVDAFAAGRVHEVGAWLHDLELVLADEVARLLDEGGGRAGSPRRTGKAARPASRPPRTPPPQAPRPTTWATPARA